MLQQDMANKEIRIHPTQKPVALYRWLAENYAKPGDLICDTHTGSASSLIAYESLGFNYVAWEKDPDYYAAAKNRMSKGIQKDIFSQ
jgi:site-specific DNA-methyltransferase (adenine-specific)